MVGRALFALVALTFVGCPSSVEPVDTFDRNAMLASLAERVIVPAQDDFVSKAIALEAAAVAHVSALGSSNAPAAKASAQAAWKSAMASWQAVEVLKVGPSADLGEETGAQGLRDQIYAWPTVNDCRVDQELVANRFEQAGYFEAALVNVYGLAALEYLLFYDAAANSCPALVTINTDGSWAALSQTELADRRARYARAAASHLVVRAKALQSAWDPAGGDFSGKFARAGQEGSPFATARVATDELFAAMFYVDLAMKDDKLAVPAGLSTDCPNATCPAALESKHARHSKQNVLANLRSFRALFVGNGPGAAEGHGFDDWLVHRGASGLSTQIVADTDAAIAAVEGVQGTFEDSLTRDVQELRDVYDKVKTVTDQLKTQLVTVLNLRVPGEGDADND